MRGNVGDDYTHYLQFYDELHWSDLLSAPAFTLLAGTLRVAHLPFSSLIFLSSLLTNLLLFLFLSHRKGNLPWLLCVVFALSGVVNQIDFVRNSISIMLFAVSTRYIDSQEPRKYYLLNALGVLFHYSALLYFLFYPLAQKQLSKTLFLTLLLGSTVLFPLHVQWFAPVQATLEASGQPILHHMAFYFTPRAHTLTFSIAFAERLLTGIAIYWLYDRLTQRPSAQTAVHAFLLYYLSLSLLSGYAVFATRLANLFVVGLWLVWPLLLSSIESLRWKIPVALAMAGFMTARLLSLTSMPQWHYTTIFTET